MAQAHAPQNMRSKCSHTASPIMSCDGWAAGDDTPPPQWVDKHKLSTVQFDVQQVNLMIPIYRNYAYLADNLAQRSRILAWCEDLVVSPSTYIPMYIYLILAT